MRRSATLVMEMPTVNQDLTLLQKAIGPCLVLLTGLFYTINQYVFKYVAAMYVSPAHEMMMLRGLHATIVGSTGLIVRRIFPLSLPPEDAVYVGIYSISYAIMAVFYFMAVHALPVSLPSVVLCALPIVVAIAARLILKEPLSIATMISTVFCIMGLAMIVKQPAAIFGLSANSNTQFLLNIGCVLIALCCFASLGLASRKISGRVSFFVTNFFYGLILVVVEMLVLYFSETKTYITVSKFFVMMGVHSIPLLGQFAYYMAHKYSYAATCSYHSLVQGILAFLADIFIFSVNVDYIQIIGLITIVLCGALITTLRVCKEQAVHPS